MSPVAAGVAHLRAADPVMRSIIDEVGDDPWGHRASRRTGEHYGALVRAIVGQQVSTKAAQAIFGRLTARFGNRTPTPEEVLADDPEELRAAAGLSRSKVTYLRSLAEHVVDGSLELDRLEQLDDDQVMAELIAVKGLGVWTAQVFLIFQLGREDVLIAGDLGVRRAAMNRYGLEALPGPEELEAIAEPWRPYRTFGCLYLWRSLDVVPV